MFYEFLKFRYLKLNNIKTWVLFGPFKICSWSDSGFKKTPDDDPRIETRVGVTFYNKNYKKWVYVCISWCKINWMTCWCFPPIYA
jgi:hypothetical protein